MDRSYIYTAPAVPEPSTWAMLLIGFAGIGLVASRKRNAHLLHGPHAANTPEKLLKLAADVTLAVCEAPGPMWARRL
jgi:hypothetical protein